MFLTVLISWGTLKPSVIPCRKGGSFSDYEFYLPIKSIAIYECRLCNKGRFCRIGQGQACRSYLHLRSEEHTSELQSRGQLVCRLLLKKQKQIGVLRSPLNTCGSPANKSKESVRETNRPISKYMI